MVTHLLADSLLLTELAENPKQQMGSKTVKKQSPTEFLTPDWAMNFNATDKQSSVAQR